MSWIFTRKNDAGEEVGTLETRPGLEYHLIAAATGIEVVPKAPQDTSSLLGIAHIGQWGIKLQAVGTPLNVSPGSPRKDSSNDPPTEQYTILPETNGRTEIILLRANDSISSPGTTGRFSLVWKAPHVQVNSSVTADREIPESEDQPVQGTAGSRDEETEDDDDLDRTVMTAVEPSTRLTPLLPASREIVQETPTVGGRVQDMSDRTIKPSPSPVEETPPEESNSKEPSAEAEVYFTALAKRHSSVKIPAKRASPAAENDSVGDTVRLSKRVKPNKAGDANGTPNKSVPIRKTATSARQKKRLSDIEPEASTPTRSQRSTHGTEKESGEVYDGPPPRVAFSNSAIPEFGKAALKFLKNNGGLHVDSITDECNVLCVKDGTLSKTPKLLQALALGIPIVTDKWLLSSAQRGHFLPLDPFIPSAPTQEREWNFSLAAIWSKPQTSLLAGYTVQFTPTLKASLKRAFADMESLCKAAGARRVVVKKAGGKEVDGEDNTIVLAVDGKDEDADAKALVESGRVCFSKDFLTNAVLRGEVDRESEEFRINVAKAEPAGKKGRKRKS